MPDRSVDVVLVEPGASEWSVALGALADVAVRLELRSVARPA